MCDYSLHAVKNRLAVEGEQLFVNKFHTGSKGLASVADFAAVQTVRPAPAGTGVFGRLAHWISERRRVASGEESYFLTAVCIPPGAKLYIEGIPKALQEQFDVGEAEEVTFAQVTAEPFRYRDAFRFENGEEVLIQKFPDGVRVEILSIELEEKAGAVIEEPAERRTAANA
jgi:hypothetical protein